MAEARVRVRGLKAGWWLWVAVAKLGPLRHILYGPLFKLFNKFWLAYWIHDPVTGEWERVA